MIRKRSLLTHLVVSNFIMIALVLGAMLWLTYATLKNNLYDNSQRRLQDTVTLARGSVEALLQSPKPQSVENLKKLRRQIDHSGQQTGVRLTVVLPGGQVAADSMELAEKMESHANREEILAAQEYDWGLSERYSMTQSHHMMYYAVALRTEDSNKILGYLRAATPIQTIEQTLWENFSKIFWGGLLAFLFAVISSYWTYAPVSRWFDQMKNYAQSVAEGRLEARLNLSKYSFKELTELGLYLNRLTEQLDQRFRSIMEQKRQKEAVFSSMGDGVLAVDHEGRIQSMNRSAARIFDLPEDLLDKTSNPPKLGEVIRNEDLIHFVTNSLGIQTAEKIELQTFNPNERFLQIQSNPLVISDNEKPGAVLVISDITRVRELENHRREFVANVSHELRTPLTSIRGFIETIMDNQELSSEQQKEFMGIVQRHSIRLNQIIEDLLALSRIEKDSEHQEIKKADTKIIEILNSAAELCRVKAQKREVEIELECPPQLSAAVNPSLIEQAVVNLTDNAIKYSSSRSKVTLKARHNESLDQVQIEVVDHGTGIPAEHLPRLFERFYRVDKARSRELGGTGLGLAIVKHIALAHGGQVGVSSQVGHGTTFSVSFPVDHLPN